MRAKSEAQKSRNKNSALAEAIVLLLLLYYYYLICLQTQSPHYKHTLSVQLRSMKTDKTERFTRALGPAESQ